MVMGALFADLTAVTTMIHFHFPGVPTGYVNLGDCLVIVSGILLGPVYGGAAAGIGSALVDLTHGYTVADFFDQDIDGNDSGGDLPETQ